MSDPGKTAVTWILGLALIFQTLVLGKKFVELWDPHKIAPVAQEAMAGGGDNGGAAKPEGAKPDAAATAAAAPKAERFEGAAPKAADNAAAAKGAAEPKAGGGAAPKGAATQRASAGDKGGKEEAAQNFDENLMLKVVLLAGALGGAMQALGSFFSFVGARQFDPSWLGWYFCRAPIGAGLGIGIYLVLRAGLMTNSGGGSSLNVFGFTALSFLAGMFNKYAIAKLTMVAEAVFATPPPQPAPLASTKPSIKKLGAATKPTGSAAFPLDITGSGFAKDSLVLFGGELLTPAPGAVTDNKITVTVPASQLAAAGKRQVQVLSHGPNGAISEPAEFEVA
jgi:hypothetical protein